MTYYNPLKEAFLYFAILDLTTRQGPGMIITIFHFTVETISCSGSGRCYISLVYVWVYIDMGLTMTMGSSQKYKRRTISHMITIYYIYVDRYLEIVLYIFNVYT